MECFLSLSDYGIGIEPGSQESPDWKSPSVIERAPYAGQIPVDNCRNPDLAATNVRLYPLPLTCESLQSMDFGRRQVNLNQFFRVDERHLGQGKSIEPVALNRSPQISPQGSYFLCLGFHQPTIRMARPQVDSHHLPWQTSRFQDYNGIGSIPEDTLLQDSQSFGRSLEVEAITWLCPLIQTPRSVSPLV